MATVKVEYEIVCSTNSAAQIDVANQIRREADRLVSEAKATMKHQDHWREYETTPINLDNIKDKPFNKEYFEDYRILLLKTFWNGILTYDTFGREKLSTHDIPDVEALRYRTTTFLKYLFTKSGVRDSFNPFNRADFVKQVLDINASLFKSVFIDSGFISLNDFIPNIDECYIRRYRDVFLAFFGNSLVYDRCFKSVERILHNTGLEMRRLWYDSLPEDIQSGIDLNILLIGGCDYCSRKEDFDEIKHLLNGTLITSFQTLQRYKDFRSLWTEHYGSKYGYTIAIEKPKLAELFNKLPKQLRLFTINHFVPGLRKDSWHKQGDKDNQRLSWKMYKQFCKDIELFRIPATEINLLKQRVFNKYRDHFPFEKRFKYGPNELSVFKPWSIFHADSEQIIENEKKELREKILEKYTYLPNYVI